MTAPQENQTMVSREPNIESIRSNLKKAAKRQPEAVQPFIQKLSVQLRNLATADADGRAALYPVMEDSMKKIEAGGCGR